ncbi:MAG: type II secretion system protein [Planctomycetota bacterium]|jgi:prepilin-type N-terminal cleavage/methylation domain-containing protein
MHGRGVFASSKFHTEGRRRDLRGCLPAGFTLIELLVVIAIIAVLMSILMPTLNRAKKQARLAKDLSNLHQWAFMWKYFTDDNDGYFAVGTAAGVEETHWLDVLRPYFKDERLLLCPEARRTEDMGARNPFKAWIQTDEDGITYTGSYGLNYWVTKEESANTSQAFDGTLRWKTPNVKGAAYAPMLVGCSLSGALVHHVDEPPEYPSQDWASGMGDQHEMRRFCMNRHNRYVCGNFMDFSARKIGLKELWELRWSRHWFRTSDSNLTPNYAPPVAWDNPAHWMFGMKDYAF